MFKKNPSTFVVDFWMGWIDYEDTGAIEGRNEVLVITEDLRNEVAIIIMYSIR